MACIVIGKWCVSTTEGSTSSGSQLSSNPIRGGRWQTATGLFNSPNDIRASWSALTHSTNLHLHQHAQNRGPARAKRVRVQSALMRISMQCLNDLSLDPRTVGVLHYLKDSVISLLSVETHRVLFQRCNSQVIASVWWIFQRGLMLNQSSERRINKSPTQMGEIEAVAMNEMDRGMGRCWLFL